MFMEKKVSIIIPTFNRQKILKKTLLAFLKQDYPKDKFELVVVNDGSLDHTKEMINDFQKEKLREICW